MGCTSRTWRFILAVLVVPVLAGPAALALPAGFTDTLVTSVGVPTGLAFTPDGRMLITTQGGALRIYANGSLLATPALSLSAICTNSERGLLGVAVDPAFAANHRLFLYYTYLRPADSVCVNRVSRFLLPDGNVVDPATEVVLLDNMQSTAGNHNGGDLHFGKDGFLYVSIGDGGCDYANDSGCGGANDASRDQNMLLGKILRITSDGGIPASNPFQGAGTARCNVNGATTPGLKCQETYAWGLRNPFRFAFDPNAAGTRFFINDVGQDAWEEIDLGQSGVDYGWNCREGRHTNNSGGPCSPTPAGMVDPLFEYSHSANVPGTSVGGCGSITGGAFVPNGLWPGFDGAYVFSDFNCGAIFSFADSGASGNAASFDTGLGGGSAVAMAFGPSGNAHALYYTTYAGGGQIRRISYSASGDNPPAAVASGFPLSGSAPLLVTFDATGSSDPDAGDTLTYFWDFGDGSSAMTASLTLQHTFTTPGSYTVQLRARDNHFAFSAPAVLQARPFHVDGPLDFFTVTPCRVLDTRNGGGTALAAGEARVIALTGLCGVPVTAQAVAANVTVVPSAAGFLDLHRAGERSGGTSVISFRNGVIRAGNAVLPVGSSGGVEVLCGAPSGAAHLIIDVVGYFD